MKIAVVLAGLAMIFAGYTNVIAQIPDDLPPEAIEDLEEAEDLMGEDGPQVGEMAPDFTLQSLDGLEITLSNLKDKTPVVLVFGSCT